MSVSNVIPEYNIIAPKEAIISWKHDPISKQLLDIIEQETYNSSFRVGNGETLGDNVIQNTARAVGYIEGLRFLQDLLELHIVVGGQEDDESEKSGNKGKKSS